MPARSARCCSNGSASPNSRSHVTCTEGMPRHEAPHHRDIRSCGHPVGGSRRRGWSRHRHHHDHHGGDGLARWACVITPARTPADVDQAYNGPRATVTNGVATFVVPTAQTNGMYFSIDTPKPAQINAAALIVFQYKGSAPGGLTVTKAQGQASRRASACWAGTDEGRWTSTSLWLGSSCRRSFRASPTAHGRPPCRWPGVVPTDPALAPFWPLVKGVLATQNSVECAS